MIWKFNIFYFEHSVIITEPFFMLYFVSGRELYRSINTNTKSGICISLLIKASPPFLLSIQLKTHRIGKWAGNYIPLKLQRKSAQHNVVITLNQAKGMPLCKLSICAGGTAPERVKRVRRAFRNTQKQGYLQGVLSLFWRCVALTQWFTSWVYCYLISC